MARPAVSYALKKISSRSSLRRSPPLFVAATSNCFADLPLDAALERLVDLEYTGVEIMIHESEGHLKPSEVSGRRGRRHPASAARPTG